MAWHRDGLASADAGLVSDKAPGSMRQVPETQKKSLSRPGILDGRKFLTFARNLASTWTNLVP